MAQRFAPPAAQRSSPVCTALLGLRFISPCVGCIARVLHGRCGCTTRRERIAHATVRRNALACVLRRAPLWSRRLPLLHALHCNGGCRLFGGCCVVWGLQQCPTAGLKGWGAHAAAQVRHGSLCRLRCCERPTHGTEAAAVAAAGAVSTMRLLFQGGMAPCCS